MKENVNETTQWRILTSKVNQDVLSELGSMKVEKYMLYKVKHDLLNRKDIVCPLLEKQNREKMFLDF